MIFEPLWSRDLHIALNSEAARIYGDYIYLTERHNKLSKIDLKTGKCIWSRKVDGAYGYLQLTDKYAFYLTQSGTLKGYCVETSETVYEHKFNDPHLGYIELCDDHILTGGWRGYSDLQTYNLKTGKSGWSRKARSAKIIDFSIPAYLGGYKILTVNHTSQKIQILNSQNGKIISKHVLPKGTTSKDLGRPYILLRDEVIFLTKNGLLLKLNTNTLSWSEELLPLKALNPNIPYIDTNNIIVRNGDYSYSLLDRLNHNVIWDVPIEHNSWRDVMAIKINADKFLIAGAHGTIKLVAKNGTVHKLNSEKRITTKLHVKSNKLIYGTKGKIKCFTLQN